jgi:anti-sigma factor RsiW
MNDSTLIGPCADYEHEIVELHDGELPPERARIVRLHVKQCLRCRSWATELAALDAGLAAELPRPALSADFDARLRERLVALTAPASRGELRSRIELEHDSLISSLRTLTWHRGVLGAAGSAAATLAVLASARALLAQGAGWMSLPGEGLDRWVAMGTLGSAIAVAALAWAATRRGVMGLGWLR